MQQKGEISQRQLTNLVFIFVIGTSTLIPPAGPAAQAGWIVQILGVLYCFLLLYLYSFLLKQFPDKSFIEVLMTVFGKYIGRLLAFFYIAYFLILASLINRDNIDFMKMVLPETPDTAFGLSMVLIAAYLLYKGLEVAARVISFIVPITFMVLFIATIALVNKMNLDNLAPVLEKGIKPVILGFYEATGWPFGEIFLFLMLFQHVLMDKGNNTSQRLKAAAKGIVFAGIFFFIAFVRNISVLSPGTVASATYPSYITFDIIQIAGIGRIDILLFMGLLLVVLGKLLICYYASITGIQQMLSLKDNKFLILPIGVIITYYANTVHPNYPDLVQFGKKATPVAVFILAFLIPFLTLITAKIKTLLET